MSNILSKLFNTDKFRTDIVTSDGKLNLGNFTQYVLTSKDFAHLANEMMKNMELAQLQGNSQTQHGFSRSFAEQVVKDSANDIHESYSIESYSTHSKDEDNNIVSEGKSKAIHTTYNKNGSVKSQKVTISNCAPSLEQENYFSTIEQKPSSVKIEDITDKSEQSVTDTNIKAIELKKEEQGHEEECTIPPHPPFLHSNSTSPQSAIISRPKAKEDAVSAKKAVSTDALMEQIRAGIKLKPTPKKAEAKKKEQSTGDALFDEVRKRLGERRAQIDHHAEEDEDLSYSDEWDECENAVPSSRFTSATTNSTAGAINHK